MVVIYKPDFYDEWFAEKRDTDVTEWCVFWPTMSVWMVPGTFDE